ncbi:hypothetical protein KW798_00385 [Candidatus Parcubacteria bacterium]|nr:hypothetical protein [Candidatus Parcubacteria bacterium]
MRTLRYAFCGALVLLGVGVFSPHAAHALVDHKTLVIMVNFTDDKVTPFDTSTVYDFFFSTAPVNDPWFPSPAAPSVDTFYQENSRGAIGFSGKVTDYVTITRASTDCASQYFDWSNKALAAVQATGENTSQYQHLVFFFPRNCSYAAGIGTVGSPGQLSQNTVWIFGYNTPRLFAHELGHNLGNRHSDSYTCNPGPLAPAANCVQNSYADVSDVMGNWDYAQYNAPHLLAMSWIPPSDVQTITANSTTTINSVESNTGVRVLKVAKADSRQFYYLSYRQQLGHDAAFLPGQFVGGTSLHIWDGSSWSQTLLTTLPGTVITDGVSIFDPMNAIEFKQISHTTNSATIAINLTPCTRIAPLVTMTPTSQTGAPGSTLTYLVVVTNRDSALCPNSNFAITPSILTGWTSAASPTSLILAPGASATSTVTMTSALNSPSISFNFSVTAYDNTFSVHYVTAKGTYVVNKTACIVAAPAITSSPLTATSTAGESVRYTLTRINNDSTSCAPSTFTAFGSLPGAGWAITTSPQPVTLNAAAASSTAIEISSPTDAVGGTYTIPVTLTDAANPAHTATVNLKYIVPPPACVPVASIVTLGPSSATVAPGVSQAYTYNITNRDPVTCSPSTFTLSGNVPSGWNETISPTSVTVAPGNFGSGSFTVTSPSSATDGDYSVSIDLTDATTPSHSASGTGTYTVATPPPGGGEGGGGSNNLSLTATPIRKGGTSLLTWYATGLGGGVTCQVSPASQIDPSAVTSFTNGSGSWGSSGNPIAARTVALNAPVTFTLTCSDGTSAPQSQSVLIKFLPSVNEI